MSQARSTAGVLASLLAGPLAVVAALTGAMLGSAGPAKAEQVLDGVYTYTQGDVVADWAIYPSCVPTVGDLRANLDLPVACRLHVSGTPSSVVRSGDARLTGGLWEFSTNVAEGMTCPDGSLAPTQETYRFDDVTMTGTRSVINNAVCNGAVGAKIVTSSFTLAYQKPLPIPVQQYPLYCEPGGVKRCY